MKGERLRARVPALLAAVIVVLAAPASRAEEDGASERVAPARTPRETEGYQHWFGGASVGRGLRFNNPYRLRTVLGDDAESLSLTATFVKLHLGRTFGSPHGFEHGASLQLSVATDGVAQEVLTPSYVLLRRFGVRSIATLRAGVPIVLEPDAGAGLEAGAGFAYLLTASLGVATELDFSLFYGAATLDQDVTTIPVLSLSAGLFVDFEVLP